MMNKKKDQGRTNCDVTTFDRAPRQSYLEELRDCLEHRDTTIYP